MSAFKCDLYHEWICQWITGTLADGYLQMIMEHVSSCDHCAFLFSQELAMSDDLEFGDEAFVADVLEATTGSSCWSAQILISESFHEPSTDDDNLLNTHLQNCPDCSELAVALPRVMQLAKITDMAVPDDRFVEAVLMKTSHAPDAPLLLFFRKVFAWIDDNLFSRPRIALETAYVVTLVFALVLHWTDIPITHAKLPIASGQHAVIVAAESIDDSLSQFTGQVQNSLDTQTHQFSMTRESLARRGRAVVDSTETALKQSANNIWSAIFRYGTRFLGWIISDTEDSHGNQSNHSTDSNS